MHKRQEAWWRSTDIPNVPWRLPRVSPSPWACGYPTSCPEAPRGCATTRHGRRRPGRPAVHRRPRAFRGGQGFDGLVTATALAVAAPRLTVQTAVYLLPLRHPVPVARQVATLAGEEVTLDGDFFRLEPGPDSARAAAARAGRDRRPLGRGAAPGRALRRRLAGPVDLPRPVRSATALIAKHAADAGRDVRAWQHGMHVWCGLGASPGAARDRLSETMEGFYTFRSENLKNTPLTEQPGR